MGLLVLLFIELYHTQKKEYKQDLYKTMQVCSYTMECPQFKFDFAEYNQTQLNKLYEDNGPYAYFSIPTSQEFMIKFYYEKTHFLDDIKEIRSTLWVRFILATFLLMGLALFFTYYTLKPIRKALQLNDEFIKDILHDFNTPISAMILNIEMFKEDYKNNHFVENISHSIDTISLLQNNLKSFLFHSHEQMEEVDVSKLLTQRVDFMRNLYPRIDFNITHKTTLICTTHMQLFTRVLDNLLSNAAKYNIPNGQVTITLTETNITIEDTGKGIKDTKKVFERYYTEQSRGLGLGLPIVKKLCKQLQIGLHLDSTPSIGTTVTLTCAQIQRVNR